MESMQVDEGEEIPQLKNTVEEADESLPTTANNEGVVPGSVQRGRDRRRVRAKGREMGAGSERGEVLSSHRATTTEARRERERL